MLGLFDDRSMVFIQVHRYTQLRKWPLLARHGKNSGESSIPNNSGSVVADGALMAKLAAEFP